MPRLTEGSKGRVGPASPGAWRSAARALNEPKDLGAAVDTKNERESFVARIKSNPHAVTSVRWLYQWEEVFIKSDLSVETFTSAKRSRLDVATGYLESYAINLCEVCQSVGSASVVGPGVSISNIPAGFSLRPISENTCVIMFPVTRKDGRIQYAFSMPNAIDGSCPSFTGGGGGGATEQPA